MPAGLLYHGFGILNIEYLRTRYNNGEIIFANIHILFTIILFMNQCE